MKIKSLIIFFVLDIFFSMLNAIEIKQTGEITLSQTKEIFIKRPGSFFATNDEMFIIIDFKACDIKFYNADGKFVNIFGAPGIGPNEFVKPSLSAYKEPFVLIGDSGQKAIFIYKRSEKDKLQFVKKYLLLDFAHDIHFIDDDNLLVAGYKTDRDGKQYNLYEFDLKNQRYKFRLLTEKSYGIDSYNDFLNQYNEKISYIGPNQYCDFSDQHIYLVWTGGVKIIRIDRKTHEYTSFGQNTGNFVQPFVTPELKKAYYERNNQIIFKIREGMSYVKDIFILNSGKICLVYFGPFDQEKGMKVMLQIYSDKGEFIKEIPLINAKASLQVELFSYFRKEKNLLYILDTITTKNYDQSHKIYPFRIEE